MKLLQAFQSRTHLFLVLEFAQGGDLGSLLLGQQCPPSSSSLVKGQQQNALEGQQQQQPLSNYSFSTGPSHHGGHRVDIPLELLYFYGGEIAIVLRFLHDHQFIYRDLKPENILLKANGHLMLTDFGVAKDYNVSSVERKTTEQQRLGRSNSFVGTRQYMSPEMLRGYPIALPRTGGAGCWLFEMAFRRRPFDAESEFALFKSIVEEDVVVSAEELQHLLQVPRSSDEVISIPSSWTSPTTTCRMPPPPQEGQGDSHVLFARESSIVFQGIRRFRLLHHC